MQIQCFECTRTHVCIWHYIFLCIIIFLALASIILEELKDVPMTGILCTFPISITFKVEYPLIAQKISMLFSFFSNLGESMNFFAHTVLLTISVYEKGPKDAKFLSELVIFFWGVKDWWVMNFLLRRRNFFALRKRNDRSASPFTLIFHEILHTDVKWQYLNYEGDRFSKKIFWTENAGKYAGKTGFLAFSRDFIICFS